MNELLVSLSERRSFSPGPLSPVFGRRSAGIAMPVFHDRVEAGRALAGELSEYQRRQDVIVLALPRGGVPVAFEVARKLNVPLDVFLVRKIGVPGQPELAMGAVAAGGVRVINEEVVRMLGIAAAIIDEVAHREERELERQERLYRPDAPKPEVAGATVILVDDGLATGSTMMAAIQALRKLNPTRIVVAVPVAPPSTCDELRNLADEVVCARTPWPFHSVSLWYEDFQQTTDEEVRELLEQAMAARSRS